MSWGVMLSETMSGWISFNDEKGRQPFSFSIDAFTPEVFRLGAPRHFTGQASFGSYHPDVSVTGTLVIRPTGPAYDLSFSLGGKGDLRAAGHKTYDIRRLRESLTTCPLLIYRDGQIVGQAEVAYRDSLITFPLKSLRLARVPY